MGLGITNFLFNFAIIYFLMSMDVRHPELSPFLRRFLDSEEMIGYRDFMHSQSAITTVMLAFAGARLIGADHRRGGMVFYLTRAIDRRHYLVGKLLTVGLLVSLMTTIPALILFLEQGILGASWKYFVDHWRLPVAILGYGLVLAGVQSCLLIAIASWIPKTVPMSMLWLGLYVLSAAAAHHLHSASNNRYWLLISIWEDMLLLGNSLFRNLPADRVPGPGLAALVLASLCLISLVLGWRCIKVVEVVS